MKLRSVISSLQFYHRVFDKTLGSLILAVRDCAIILTVFHEQWLRNLRNVIVAWKISWDRTQFFSFRNLYITVENLKMITSAKLRSKKVLLEFKELSFKGVKWMHTTMNVHCSIFSLGHTSLLFFNICIWNKIFPREVIIKQLLSPVAQLQAQKKKLFLQFCWKKFADSNGK